MPQDPYAAIAQTVDPYADIAVPAKGFQISKPSTIPNARIRNLPNPAEGETSPLGALYHGAKTGATLGMLPAAAAAIPMTIPAAVGTATGIVGGAAAGAGAKAGAEALGAGELGQEAAGDVGNIVGGLLGAGFGEAGTKIGQRIYNALPKELQQEVNGLVGGRMVHAARLIRAAAKMLPETTEATVPQAPAPTSAAAAPSGQITPEGQNYLGRLQEIARQIEAQSEPAKPKNVTPSRAAALKKPLTPAASADDLTNLLQESLKRAKAAKSKSLGDLQ